MPKIPTQARHAMTEPLLQRIVQQPLRHRLPILCRCLNRWGDDRHRCGFDPCTLHAEKHRRQTITETRPEWSNCPNLKQEGGCHVAGDGNSSRRWREKIRPTFRASGVKANAPCWLCGHPINYNNRDINDDETWEPDHLYPRSTHPHLAEDPGNLRHSHRGCNRTRGNNLHVIGLGILTRNWLE